MVRGRKLPGIGERPCRNLDELVKRENLTPIAFKFRSVLDL